MTSKRQIADFQKFQTSTIKSAFNRPAADFIAVPKSEQTGSGSQTSSICQIDHTGTKVTMHYLPSMPHSDKYPAAVL
jgi:hypothetical protein